jgi:hypothetical protein
MSGVHINLMLVFREHFLHITKDVKKLAKALAKRKLSPPLKTLAIEHLLKSKYHATRLGVFNERQLTTIDGIFNKAMRQAIYRPPPKLSLRRRTKTPKRSRPRPTTHAR